jgi:hypothetical protein
MLKICRDKHFLRQETIFAFKNLKPEKTERRERETRER